MKKLIVLLTIAFIGSCSSDDGSSASAELYWAKINAGDGHTLAIRSDGTLWAWGWNVVGQVGDGTTVDKLSPIQIGSNNNWKEISAGGYHSLALTNDGKLWAWGANDAGQVGDGSGETITSPLQIGDDTWLMISGGHLFSSALKSDGTIWCWGYDSVGAIGDAEWVYPYTNFLPEKVGADDDWTFVNAGAHFVIARKSNGTVWGWGMNANGELGIDQITEDDWMFQTPMASDNIGTSWKHIDCGQHAVGLKSDGKLYAWGDNSIGQLGIGNDLDVAYPVPIQIGTATWKFITAGNINTAAIKTDGTLWTWGANTVGQLGVGNDIDQYTPFQVGTDNDWKTVSISVTHGLGLKDDNSLWSWGDILGNGTGNNSNIPILVPCPQ